MLHYFTIKLVVLYKCLKFIVKKSFIFYFSSFTINRADKGTKIYFGDKKRGGSFNDYLEIEVKRAIMTPRDYRTFNADIDDGYVKGVYKEYNGMWGCWTGCGLTGHMSVASVSF